MHPSLQRFFLLLCLTLATYQLAHSQVLMVDKAYDYLLKNNPQKALEAIDVASAHEITSKDPRTWYLKGFIYKELYKKNSGDTLATPEDLRKRALEALNKSIGLDTKGTHTKDNRALIDFLCTSYYNEAIDHFNAKAYSKALAGFKEVVAIKANQAPDNEYADALYYAGYAANQLGDKTGAQSYYEKGLTLPRQSAALYYDLATLYQEKTQHDQAAKLIEAGRKKFPDDTDLRTAEINLALATSQFAKAESLVDSYMLFDPKNIEVMLVAGTVYGKLIQAADSTGKVAYFNKRKAIYRKVLAADPENFMANYNMGITLYNRAVDLINSQSYDLDIMQLNEVLEICTALFKEALPYVNKANRLAPNNKNTLTALEGIYYNLNEKEKSREIRSKINSMN